MTPRGGTTFDLSGMVGKIYKENHYALLHTLRFRRRRLFMFSHDAPWLAEFIKRSFNHCYTQSRKALGLVVSEWKIFNIFSHCKSMEANDRALWFWRKFFPL